MTIVDVVHDVLCLLMPPTSCRQLLQMTDAQLADLYFDLYDLEKTGEVAKSSIISMLFATPQHYSRTCYVQTTVIDLEAFSEQKR
jgi:hypothetical protein